VSRMAVIGAGLAVAALSGLDWSGRGREPGEGHDRAKERERLMREARAHVPAPEGETRQQRRARERKAAKLSSPALEASTLQSKGG
jgi:hypothetical protein